MQVQKGTCKKTGIDMNFKKDIKARLFIALVSLVAIYRFGT